MARSVPLWVIPSLIVFVLVVVCGCGGGGSRLLAMSGSGRITSSDHLLVKGAYCDAVGFTPTRDGWVEVRMTRSGGDPVWDPFVNVWLGVWPGSSNYVGYNDDSSGRDACYEFYADKGQRYTAAFTTCAASDFGTYSWSIREVSVHSAAAQVAPTVTKPAANGSDANQRK